MKTINDFKKEIREEENALEERAFEIYCKRELSRQMKIVEEHKKLYDSTIKRMDNLTIENLKEEFNKLDYSLGSSMKVKDAIIKELKNNT